MNRTDRALFFKVEGAFQNTMRAGNLKSIGETAEAIAYSWKHAHSETKVRLNREAGILIAKMFEITLAGFRSSDLKQRGAAESMAEVLLALWKMAQRATDDQKP